ncbi:DnaJ domain-containing protein [Candidatus Nitronereus thalassa]|uniref:DnaJ domain-containing protein n=1 Tax=Candidatus Nitronereus thalassa TaxID=3020898 RepID=A0ABU3K6U2_9BACT|nr:DnaJ domain-containing protein [Candidatus Nitronereus thalassa]MDT7042053.1 DnaJ domain-containing protein [Candidatus Nitronereus thalassa]
MAFDERAKARYFRGMRRRIIELKSKFETSMDFAIDTMMLEREESYFVVEKGLEEVERMIGIIEEELDEVVELNHAQRLEARLEFVEDRFEEFDSEIYQRPKRRRRKINLFDFFKKATGGMGGDPTASHGEINSHEQAYQALGLEFGASMAAITRAFRLRAKKLHPDFNKGDRSDEPELRRIIEAYQYLRADSTIPRTEAQGTESQNWSGMNE